MLWFVILIPYYIVYLVVHSCHKCSNSLLDSSYLYPIYTHSPLLAHHFYTNYVFRKRCSHNIHLSRTMYLGTLNIKDEIKQLVICSLKFKPFYIILVENVKYILVLFLTVTFFIDWQTSIDVLNPFCLKQDFWCASVCIVTCAGSIQAPGAVASKYLNPFYHPSTRLSSSQTSFTICQFRANNCSCSFDATYNIKEGNVTYALVCL